jgi:chorismate dehydratase
VWAVRPEALAANGVSAAELTATLVASRDAGLANIAALVDEWAPRVGLPRETVRAYLTRNIHYRLDEDCLRAVRLFRELAAEHGVLPILKSLRMLG